MGTDNKTLYWAYLHSDNTIIVKRWHGDVKDYTSDCENNDFVKEVVQPFEAESRDKAFEYAFLKLNKLS